VVKKICAVIAFIITILSACYFALNGSGEYEYEGSTGNPDSLDRVEKDSILGSTLQESLDDEFDLLDDITPIDTTKTPPDTLINP
jgi:hypothetical protein